MVPVFFVCLLVGFLFYSLKYVASYMLGCGFFFSKKTIVDVFFFMACVGWKILLLSVPAALQYQSPPFSCHSVVLVYLFVNLSVPPGEGGLKGESTK